jgi:lipopolysaccharide export system protein LptC
MNAVASDRYTRLISWLKVIFPLTALAILSTLFLLSRSNDPEAIIPFADKEIQDRLRDQQVTGPFFAGTTTDGDKVSFSAEKLTTPQGNTGPNEAFDVKAVLEMTGGNVVMLEADMATFDIAADLARLRDSVVISTSDGYRLASELLETRMSSLSLTSPGPVEGEAPGGTLSAGSMALVPGESADAPQLIFTNGVKLVYTPQKSKE